MRSCFDAHGYESPSPPLERGVKGREGLRGVRKGLKYSASKLVQGHISHTGFPNGFFYEVGP
jgi:hypothetical protein